MSFTEKFKITNDTFGNWQPHENRETCLIAAGLPAWYDNNPAYPIPRMKMTAEASKKFNERVRKYKECLKNPKIASNNITNTDLSRVGKTTNTAQPKKINVKNIAIISFVSLLLIFGALKLTNTI